MRNKEDEIKGKWCQLGVCSYNSIAVERYRHTEPEWDIHWHIHVE
jgi:hypothetical protein